MYLARLGGQGTLIQSVKSVKREGLVHVLGVVAQSHPDGETIQDLVKLLPFGHAIVSNLLNQNIVFCVLIELSQISGLAVGSKSMCERLDAFITEHKIKPVIDRVFGWTEAIEALDYLDSGSHFGKIVIRID
jgi:D-arabinose 1-dehydrogenase-like Zn-dependent alcohol dehydrogenase